MSRIRLEADHAVVILTQGYEAVIDLEDAERVSQYRWCVGFRRGSPYARRNFWSPQTKKSREISLSKFILGDDPPGSEQVVSLDSNLLNSRRTNLRLAPSGRNRSGRTGHRRNPSGLMGTRFVKARGRWQARINRDGEAFSLGYFDTVEEAHEAYKAAAAKLLGEFYRP